MWFSKNKKRDAFEDRQQKQRVWQFRRRLIDSKTPNERPEQLSDRVWERSNRCVPVAFIPDRGADFDPTQLFFASTKELSDNGLSLITTERVECVECICGFWLDGPKLVGGIVRRVLPFGGNMFEVGIEMVDVIDSAEMLHLLNDQLHALVPVPTDASKDESEQPEAGARLAVS